MGKKIASSGPRITRKGIPRLGEKGGQFRTSFTKKQGDGKHFFLGAPAKGFSGSFAFESGMAAASNRAKDNLESLFLREMKRVTGKNIKFIGTSARIAVKRSVHAFGDIHRTLTTNVKGEVTSTKLVGTVRGASQIMPRAAITGARFKGTSVHVRNGRKLTKDQTDFGLMFDETVTNLGTIGLNELINKAINDPSVRNAALSATERAHKKRFKSGIMPMYPETKRGKVSSTTPFMRIAEAAWFSDKYSRSGAHFGFNPKRLERLDQGKALALNYGLGRGDGKKINRPGRKKTMRSVG